MVKGTATYGLAIIAILAIVGMVFFIKESTVSLDQLLDQLFVGKVYALLGVVSQCSEETEEEDCEGYACVSSRCKKSCGTDSDCAEGYFCLVKPERGECYEESEEGYTAGGTVSGVSQVDLFEERDEHLLFQLVTFDYAECDGSCDENGIGLLTALSDESFHWHEASAIKNVAMMNNIYMEFEPTQGQKSYVLFPDTAVLRPNTWVMVAATVTVFSPKAHGVILSKQTKDCNAPLYALTIQDEKYHFIISIDGKTYKLSSDTAVARGSETRLLAFYDGTQIKFLVDDTIEDAAKVEGRISTSSGSSHLALGRSTVCNAYQFDGFMEDVYIWGE